MQMLLLAIPLIPHPFLATAPGLGHRVHGPSTRIQEFRSPSGLLHREQHTPPATPLLAKCLGMQRTTWCCVERGPWSALPTSSVSESTLQSSQSGGN